MTKLTLAFLFIFTSLKGFPQVTDNDLINALLGKNYYETHPILDKLGVWYHYNFQPIKTASGEDIKPKVYSISNSVGSVKVYI